VEGWEWDHTQWPGEQFPTAVRSILSHCVKQLILFFSSSKAELDADPIVRERPVVLQSKDGHAIWVNSKVLDSVPSLPDTVEGGVICARRI